MKRLLVVTLLLVAQAIPATAQSREKGLDQWLDRSLIPYVQQQLTTHPRFRDETVMFVVLRDNAPTPSSNALALTLRDRILEAAVDTNGVSIGWQQGRSGNVVEPGTKDCVNDDVHYYVGVELTQELDGSYAVNVRALDLEDRTWVTGFGKRWQGRLNTSQRQALRLQRIDETFLGARDVPFTVAQTDLLASQLAHQLACTLQQQLEEDYIVSADGASGTTELAGTLELISNNLASRQALKLASEPGDANAVLSGKAHRIDGNLHQYWLTVTPQPGTEHLASLSASAYIVLPDSAPSIAVTKSPAREPAPTVETANYRPPASVSVPNAGGDGLIGSLRITSPASVGECEWPCSMLRTNANTDAIVFILEHQANHGLVRLSGGECRQRTVARIVRNGESLNFPISKTTTDSRNWTAIHDWQLNPPVDTYYAVAVTDADVARSMANLIDALPLRCTNSLRPGKRGDELRDWLAEFATFAAQSATHLDWRAIQVRDVT
ncbi:MAG: hypothetical protein AAFN50_06375 [Pseudomonadota bacterium]